MSSRSEDVKTKLVRLAFADGLLKPKVNEKSGKSNYGCSLLIAKGADYAELQEAAVSTAVAEWGDKAKQMIKDGLIKSPFLDGDGPQGKSKKTGEPHKGFPGHVFVRCISGTDYPPKCVNKKIQPTASADDIYSGVYGYAVVNAFTWENKENGKGVSFGISLFQSAGYGEKLGGGGADPSQFFEAIPDEGDAPEETKSGAGAAGLFG